MIRRLALLPLALCLGTALGAGDPGTHSVRLTASTPEISVAPRAPGRRPLQLPGLAYLVRLTAGCGESFSAQAISVTIADSRRTIVGPSLGSDTEPTDLTIDVPEQQLPPIIVSDFCVARPTGESSGDTQYSADPRATVVIPAVLSAHASLVCRNEEQEEITYASHPLDVVLVCQDVTEAE